MLPPHSDLTQLLWLHLGTGDVVDIFKNTSRERRNRLGGNPNLPGGSHGTVWLQSAVRFKLFLPSTPAVHLFHGSTQRPGPRKVFPNRATCFILCIENYLFCYDR